MDSGAPGLWARRVALGARGWSEAAAARRGEAVVLEVRQPEDRAAEVERLRGAGDVPTDGRRRAKATATVPDAMARGEARGVPTPGESARSVPANAVAADQAAERIEGALGSDGGWPAGGGTQALMAAGMVGRTREAMDLRGLIETAEERRARVEVYR